MNYYLRLDASNIVLEGYLSDSSSDTLYQQDATEDFSIIVFDDAGNYNYKFINSQLVSLTKDEKYEKRFGVSLLNEAKKNKLKDLEIAVADKIGQGILFDGHIFSLSANAQLNWTNVKYNKAGITFPHECSIQDPPYTYYLAEADVDTFYALAFNTIDGILKIGRSHRANILSLTTSVDVVSYEMTF